MNILTRFIAGFRAAIDGGWFDKRLWHTVGGSRATTAKVDVSEDSALNYAAVWCATRLMCGTGASLPLPIYQGDEDARKKDKTHAAYRLLNIAPNPEQTAFNFRSVMWQWQINWGNAYAEIVREGNSPYAPLVSLWPLHPARVTPKRYEDDQLYYEVRNTRGLKEAELAPWQMLHLPSILTCDGIIGRGVIEHARETIGGGLAAEKRANHRLGSGNTPTAVIEHPGKWDKPARDQFRAEWKEIYGGPSGDTVAVIQGGGVVKPLIGLSEKDSQFLETRQFDIEEVARWYGISPHLLQHLLRATFNNIEELGIDFVRYCLVHWCEIWEQAIRMKLFTEDEQGDYFAEHNVDALMRGNAAARAAFYQAMTNAAIMTRNECRKLENLDAVPGGDVFLVQGATVPLDEGGKPESAFAQGASSTTATVPADDSSAAENIKAHVAHRVEFIMQRDLARLLTKESHKMESCAKTPDGFVCRVEDFYAAHRTLLIDAVSDTAAALGSCGYEIDASALATAWVGEGKTMMLEAAGAAVTGAELTESVKRVISSKTWSERPQRAVERAKNATSVV